MENKYNLIDLGNISEPAAGVVNNFIDKISSALGWMVTPKNIKPAIIEANKSIIEEISNRQDINPIERAVIVNNCKKIVKEYKNQINTMQIAIEHLNPNAKSKEVKDDWITFFFDKVKDVTEDDMKIIWGKILAGEFNEPGTYTKRLLHTMSILDSDMASTFKKIRSSCFYREPQLLTFIYRTNNHNIDNSKVYRNLGMIFRDFRELDSLGLIEYRYPNFYKLQNDNKKLIYYGNKAIKLTCDKKVIETGNVSLTEVGKQLCRITEPEYDDRILDICVKAWKILGYNPIVKQIENDR